jgi:hypothetical protein
METYSPPIDGGQFSAEKVLFPSDRRVVRAASKQPDPTAVG